MNITMRQVAAFLAVAEQQSFTRAGKLLNISQSAVSSLIHELEDQVGVGLFMRTSRCVSLTPEGHDFFPVARKAREEFEQVEQFASELRKQRSGHVYLAGEPLMCCSLLPVVIRDFIAGAPGIRLKLRDVHISRIQKMILEGVVDIGLGPQWPLEPEISAEPLFTSRVYMMCRPDHPLAGKSVTLKQLKHEKLIAAVPQTLNQLSPSIMGTGEVKITHEVHQISTAFALAAAGKGTVINAGYGMFLAKAFGLVAVPIVQPDVYQNVLVYTCKTRHQSPASLIFSSFLREFVSRNEPEDFGRNIAG